MLGDVNDDEKELYGDGAAAAEEAPHPAKLAETARSSARMANLRKILSKIE